MRWERGFFRVTAGLAAIWLTVVGGFSLIVAWDTVWISMQPKPIVRLAAPWLCDPIIYLGTEIESPDPACRDVRRAVQIDKERENLFWGIVLAFGPILVAFSLFYLGRWIARGFRP